MVMLAGSLASTLLGCGATSRDPSGADQTAGKSAAVSAMGSGGEPAAGGMSPGGGATPAVGGMGGSAASPTVGGTGGSIAGSSGAQCTGEAWPQGCAPICDKPMAGCLLTDADQLPSESVSIEAQVIAAETLEPGAKAVACIGFEGPASADDSSTLISLKDGAGQTWSLWFPTRLVLATRFAQGTTLQISYLREVPTLFAVDQRLVVSEEDEVVLFVEKTSRALPPISGVDVTLETGELACPWTAIACSEARAHTIAKSAGESITDPCGSEVGGFSVSSLAHLARGRTCGSNVCDFTSSYYAAGVRIKQ